MIPELLDFDYGLNNDSIVLDAGAYLGKWAEAVVKKYGCAIHCYEPFRTHYEEAKARLAPYPTVQIDEAALGIEDGRVMMTQQDDSSGAYQEGYKQNLKSVSIVRILNHGDVDLFKLNVEGMEYELMETVLNSNKIGGIRAFQIQWHWNAPASKLRWQAIRERLSETHICAKATDTNWNIWLKK